MKTLINLFWSISLTLLPWLGYTQCVNCQSATVTGTNASAIGTEPTATGNSSFAGGSGSTAQGDYSFAFGYQCKAMGSSSFAFGAMAEAQTTSSIVIGRHLKTVSSGGFIIGTGYGPTQLLTNPNSYSLMVGFNSTLPTLFVSSSYGATATGKIGIGNITNPTAKLHLLSDENEPAVIKLEHRTIGANRYSGIIFSDEHAITASEADNLVFSTAINTEFVFQHGDIYLEDINSGIIMKSPNGQCWRGTVTDSGTLQFTQVNCTTVVTSKQTETTGDKKFRIFPNPASHVLNIEIPEGITNALAIITNLEGRYTSTHQLPRQCTTLDISALPSGAYVVSILVNGSQIIAHQLMIP
jgi:autotransporter adhesin